MSGISSSKIRCAGNYSLDWLHCATVTSDKRDKSFCTKAITIIDNFEKALGSTDTDKSQFLKAISAIDELSVVNFSDKCCGKFLMSLTKFFLYVKLQKCFSRFFKRGQFTDSALALNKEIFLKNCNKS